MILELIRSSTFLQIFKRNNSNEAEQPSLVSQYLLNHLLTFFHLHHVRFKSPSPRQFPLHHSTTHRHLSKAILLLPLLLRSIILRTTFLTGNLSIYRLLTWIPLRRTFNDKSNKRRRCFCNYFSSILRGALNSVCSMHLLCRPRCGNLLSFSMKADSQDVARRVCTTIDDNWTPSSSTFTRKRI